jgi:hypothetical protein
MKDGKMFVNSENYNLHTTGNYTTIPHTMFFANIGAGPEGAPLGHNPPYDSFTSQTRLRWV